jgi:hypothetical protein
MGPVTIEKQPTVEVTMGPVTIEKQPTVEVTMGPISIERPSTAEVNMGPVSIERHGPAVVGTMTGWADLSSEDDPPPAANPSTGTKDPLLGKVLRSVRWP